MVGNRAGQPHQVVVRRVPPGLRGQTGDVIMIDGPQVLPSHDVLAGPVQPHRLGERDAGRAVPTAGQHQRPAGRLDPVDTHGKQLRADASAPPRRVDRDENIAQVGVVAHRHPQPERCDHSSVRVPGDRCLRRFAVPAVPDARDEVVDRRVQLLRAVDQPGRFRDGDGAGDIRDRRVGRVDPGNVHGVTQAPQKPVARLICRNSPVRELRCREPRCRHQRRERFNSGNDLDGCADSRVGRNGPDVTGHECPARGCRGQADQGVVHRPTGQIQGCKNLGQSSGNRSGRRD